MSNSGLHPMELKWALEKISKVQQPDVHFHNGGVYRIPVMSYLSYLNNEVDINGRVICDNYLRERSVSIYRIVEFKAVPYGYDKNEQWLEWVLV